MYFQLILYVQCTCIYIASQDTKIKLINIIIKEQTIYHNSFYIVSPNFQIHQLLRYGWTSFVVEELRADSLIALLTLSELKIVIIQKMWPWTVLKVRASQYN